MKDLKEEHSILFQTETDNQEALQRVECALHFLWKDENISCHDKVACDYDYEELIGALLSAKMELKELAEIRRREEE